MCVFGEIGLSGEVRQVTRADARLKEAEKLGFRMSMNPPLKSTKSLTITVKTLDTVKSLFNALEVPQKTRPMVAV